mmetsp:Transcript_7159/g.15649  ORF Transcript_7159/g.15649 Transcript_7159/m.15649 type:complete len:206 (-) Transcript_7159:693-1310(-)
MCLPHLSADALGVCSTAPRPMRPPHRSVDAPEQALLHALVLGERLILAGLVIPHDVEQGGQCQTRFHLYHTVPHAGWGGVVACGQLVAGNLRVEVVDVVVLDAQRHPLEPPGHLQEGGTQQGGLAPVVLIGLHAVALVHAMLQVEEQHTHAGSSPHSQHLHPPEPVAQPQQLHCADLQGALDVDKGHASAMSPLARDAVEHEKDE